jgi:hypothetical protein
MMVIMMMMMIRWTWTIKSQLQHAAEPVARDATNKAHATTAPGSQLIAHDTITNQPTTKPTNRERTDIVITIYIIITCSAAFPFEDGRTDNPTVADGRGWEERGEEKEKKENVSEIRKKSHCAPSIPGACTCTYIYATCTHASHSIEPIQHHGAIHSNSERAERKKNQKKLLSFFAFLFFVFF